MKSTKKNALALLALAIFALGLLLLFYAPQTWLKIIGGVIALVSIMVALDYISDSL